MAAFLTGGCSEGEPFGHPSAEREKRVEVSFRLEAVGTDVSLVPMTRATSYTQWFRNTARLLILKKADTRWIVDTTQTVLLDAQSGPWAELKIAGDLPPCPFNLELRPGDYRIVAVINWGSADWNNDLVPGKVVSDETDGSLRTPPLLTYTISTHWMNNGYRQLSREVFVAVADFPVPKSGDLHSAGVPPVTLRAERRVAKFRVLLKDKPSPVNGFSFVVDVGMRSTRIMGYDRRITSYPNYKITDASIVNISSEPMRRAMVKVGLTYDTGADKMNEALDILRGLPAKVKDVSENPSDITAYFSDYTDSALVITFYYYIEKQGDILKVTSDMNLAILAAFNKAGLNFAFPTRTLLVQRGGEDAGSRDESVPGNAPQTPNS